MDYTGQNIIGRLCDDGRTCGHLLGGTFDLERIVQIADAQYVELRFIIPREMFDQIERRCDGRRIARSELISTWIRRGLSDGR